MKVETKDHGFGEPAESVGVIFGDLALAIFSLSLFAATTVRTTETLACVYT